MLGHKFSSSKRFGFALLASLGSLSLACSSSSDPDGNGNNGDEVIGGVSTADPVFDAVGAIGGYPPAMPGASEEPEFEASCTAVLISPTTVLTAKHCLLNTDDPRIEYDQLIPLYFALGPNVRQQQIAKVRIAGFVTTLPGKAGFFDMSTEFGGGSDIALLSLAEPITSVAPLRVASAPLNNADVGSLLTTVGYGLNDDVTFTGNGVRRVASLPLRATSGPAMPTIFPTFDDFFANEQAVFGYPEVAREPLESKYTRPLLEDLEVLAGGGKYDASNCFGDSGGPVLRREAGEWVVRAVVSGAGHTTLEGECSGSSLYANLGPEVQALLARKDDPCLGIPAEGRCIAGATVHCKVDGDVRKPEIVDCASAGGMCGIDANGHAACGAPVPELPPRTCSALSAPTSTPVSPVNVAASAPLPVGGVLVDGDYVLEKAETYWGDGAAVEPVEGQDLTMLIHVSNGTLEVVSSTGTTFGVPFNRNDGTTTRFEILGGGEGWLTGRTTCPSTRNAILYYSVQGDRLTLFQYVPSSFSGGRSVEVGTYRRQGDDYTASLK